MENFNKKIIKLKEEINDIKDELKFYKRRFENLKWFVEEESKRTWNGFSKLEKKFKIKLNPRKKSNN